VFHHGRVGINTDRPDEALTIHGNLRLTGALLQPSDERLKHALRPVDTSHSLRILSALQLFHFRYRPEYEQKLSLDSSKDRVGVLAQQLRRLLPDAVKECRSECGISSPVHAQPPNLLMVDKDRLLMECLAALQQLHLQHNRLQHTLQQLQARLQMLHGHATQLLPIGLLFCSIAFVLLLVARQFSLGS
jgi:hypothetical protein